MLDCTGLIRCHPQLVTLTSDLLTLKSFLVLVVSNLIKIIPPSVSSVLETRKPGFIITIIAIVDFYGTYYK